MYLHSNIAQEKFSLRTQSLDCTSSGQSSNVGFPVLLKFKYKHKKTKVKVESERGTELRMAAAQSACLVMDNDFKVS